MIGHLVNALMGHPLKPDASFKLTEEDNRKLEQSDLTIFEDKIVCRVCGGYCGQCSNGSLIGMDAKEFLTTRS